MSELRVDNIVDMGGSGAPQLRKGASVTGISTITQAVIGNTTINAGGINATGIVTSSSNKFVGDLASGNITAGVMTATSSVVASNITINSGGVNASGIVSATSYIGNGANLTGVGLTIAPLIYSPELAATGVASKPTIELSFNQRIKAGSGNVVLRMVGAGSTIIENFSVGSSVTINNDGTLPKLSFTPTSSLSPDSVIYVDIPAGAIETPAGTDIKATNWTFTTKNIFNYWGAGWNSYGRLGQNSLSPGGVSSPVQIGSHKWTQISSSGNGGMGSKSDGTLWTWGYNPQGQMGINDVITRSSPVQIPGTTWTTSNICFHDYSAAVRTDGTLWMWGSNAPGALGQNNRTQYSSPVQVGSDTTWSTGEYKLSTGTTTFAIKTDGTLWTWGGDSEFGNTGQNSLIKYSSPVQVGSESTWSEAACGMYHAAVIKTDGTLWCWGQGTDGEIGNNAATNRSSPIQVGSESTWYKASASAAGGRTAAIKTDGTLWTWGGNNYGSLGQNNTTKYSSPVQIPGTTWSDLGNVGNYSFGAIKTDGTLWVWGENDKGMLGINQPANSHRSSPVQIPGTTWSVVARSGGGLMAGKP